MSKWIISETQFSGWKPFITVLLMYVFYSQAASAAVRVWAHARVVVERVPQHVLEPPVSLLPQSEKRSQKSNVELKTKPSYNSLGLLFFQIFTSLVDRRLEVSLISPVSAVSLSGMSVIVLVMISCNQTYVIIWDTMAKVKDGLELWAC